MSSSITNQAPPTMPVGAHVVVDIDTTSSEEQEVDNELYLKYVSIFEEYFRCLNAHDLDGMQRFVTPDICYQFLDSHNNLIHQLTWEGYRDVMENCMFASFPDFKLTFGQSPRTLTRHPKTGHLVVWPFHMIATGTHTGAPFCFGPCPPIATNGKFIELDPEYACFTFRPNSDQICVHEIRGHQELTGPAGFYTKLGGFPLLGTLPPSLPEE